MALPSPEERDELLRALKGLVEARGHLPLVASHLLEPSPAYFPDAWRPDEDGAANVARRLLGYAGLGHLEVEVTAGEGTQEVDRSHESTVGGTSESWHRAGSVGWFSGIRDGVCSFGVDLASLGDAEGLVATMCHEVAHAYRRVHGLEVEDRELEELLTDVTTVFLGFGILTTNGSYRYRQSGELLGTMTITRWSHERTGYLSPDSMSFLLAACVEARRLGGARTGHVEAVLEPNQAGAYRSARARLRKLDPPLVQALGLPRNARWPDPAPLERLDRPRSLPEAPAAAAPAPQPRPNEGSPVFRVRRARTVQYGHAGVWVGLALGILAWRAGLATETIAWTVGAGTVLGAFIGSRSLHFRCSDPQCARRLDRATRACPGCGGEISGEIAHENERLEAEERLRGRGSA